MTEQQKHVTQSSSRRPRGLFDCLSEAQLLTFVRIFDPFQSAAPVHKFTTRGRNKLGVL